MLSLTLPSNLQTYVKFKDAQNQYDTYKPYPSAIYSIQKRPNIFKTKLVKIKSQINIKNIIYSMAIKPIKSYAV